jgi:hypothetical protein
MQVNFEGLAQNSRNLYMFLEYVPGGELFTHLREEGMFEPHKAAYLLFYSGFMQRTSSLSSNTYTPETSYTAT